MAIRDAVNSNMMEIINICGQLNRVASCEIINHCNEPLPFKSVSVQEASINSEKYDAVLVMNSSPNFFSGEFNEGVISIYKLLAKLHCPIFYLFNDMRLKPPQLWTRVRTKKWNIWREEDFKITAPVYIVSQFKSIGGRWLDNLAKRVDLRDVKHVDFGVWLLDGYQSKLIENDGEYDLIYGGSFRGGSREQKFEEFLFGRRSSVAIYGSMKESQFGNAGDANGQPEFLRKKVKAADVIKMNAKGFSTIVVGEKGYNGNIETIRLYEAMLASSVCFIDDDFDSAHEILGNGFSYVKSGDEIDEKIALLKSDQGLHSQILEDQLSYLERKSRVNYIDELVSYIEEKA